MTDFHPSPAPNSGLKIPLLDYLQLALLPVSLTWSLVQVTFRRTKNIGQNEIPFLKDYLLTIARAIPIPFSVSRILYTPKPTLESPRFRAHASSIYQPVTHSRVAGYWLCRGAPGHAIEARESDIVLYYLHGGAYTTGSPASLLPAVLRIAELAAQRGITLSCFALQYSYAPEQVWPTQLHQAVAGYRYLLQQQEIPAARVAVLGESAGGHLALSMLVQMGAEGLAPPGRGLFLCSPWVDLACTRGSYVRNRYRDFLSRASLRVCGRQLFPDRDVSGDGAAGGPVVDFSAPDLPGGGVSWKGILPSRVWVSVGGDEVFLDEIVALKQSLESAGVVVEMEVEPGEVHVWQGVKDVFDVGKYLKMTGDVPEDLLPGARNIANAVLAEVRG
ncbi:uncharacterized protein L3040_001961 [Drepanopeziza brunnea f. sp. 'multigermtubi']|nr:hypothetical protein L3040_001961 [Drepanopeziza brunnea f. sp. 'multigermtubi']